jgi:hypothetical protein
LEIIIQVFNLLIFYFTEKNGLVLIFNNSLIVSSDNLLMENFEINQRTSHNLSRLFKASNYDVESYGNRSTFEIKEIFESLKKRSFKSFHSVFVFAFAHGLNKNVIAQPSQTKLNHFNIKNENECIFTYDIINLLKDIPELIGKPKLVFFDAASSKLDIEKEFLIGYASSNQICAPKEILKHFRFPDQDPLYINILLTLWLDNKDMEIQELLEVVNEWFKENDDGSKYAIKPFYESKLNDRGFFFIRPECYRT